MSSQGPLSAGTFADNAAIGTVLWSGAANAGASDNTYATALPFNASTHYLVGSNFGFTAPASAVLDGLFGEAEGNSSQPNNLIDNSIVLLIAGSGVGVDQKRSASTFWPTSDAYQGWGGPTSLWGVTPGVLLGSDINDSGSGFAISVSSTVFLTASIDHMRMTAYFTVRGVQFRQQSTVPVMRAAMR